MKPTHLLLASVCIVAGCDEPCHGYATAIGCEESLHIRLSAALTGEGEYEFELSGGRVSKCIFGVGTGQLGSCPGAMPLVEGGAVVGLVVVGRVNGALNVVVRRDGRELVRDTFVPKYTSPEACSGLCPTANVTLKTEGVEDSAVGTGGGPQGAAGGGGVGPAACDRAGWTGPYTATYEPISTTCPELSSRAWDFEMGVEQSLFCTLTELQWSDDGCTRNAVLSCMGEGASYQWTLVLTESSEGPHLLTGSGELSSTGSVVCSGSYSVTYTRPQ